MASRQKNKTNQYTVHQNYIHSQYGDVFSDYLSPEKNTMDIAKSVSNLEGYDCQVLQKSNNAKKIKAVNNICKKEKLSSVNARHLVEDIMIMRHYKDLHGDYHEDYID